ncbi:MAG: hypothetical protein PVI57_00030 [Gemmatimonadota bacterium]
MSSERRQKRKEMRLVQSEAAWLQKALFALGKAEDAHEKLADFRGEGDPGEYSFHLNGEDVSVESIEEAVEGRLQGLKEKLRERRQSLR